jgi:8-oxo-dGTP pyrophosphatase MutT (NUDIX family)
MNTHPQFNIRCRGILNKDGNLFVVKHRETSEFYVLPGGHLEENENPLDCCKREIKEELGLEIKNAELKYVYHWVNPEDNITNIEFIFLVTEFSNLEDINVLTSSHAFEIFDSKWVDKNTEIVVKPEFIMTDFNENEFKFAGIRFL